MPTVTAEQIRQAKSVDTLDYLRTYEPHSIRKSKGSRDEYYLIEHDSLKISNGRFNWFSRGIGRYSALDFLVKVRGMGFVDAVIHLTDGGEAYESKSPPPPKTAPPKSFTLPPPNANNDRVIAYLRGRGIDRDIIKRCIDSGTLYEGAAHNCVFVGYDGNAPRFACERGTADGYKKDISGSDKRFSFVMPPNTPDSRNLMVCEAPVDVLSHASLHKLDGIMRVPAKSADFVGEGGATERNGFPPQGGSSVAQSATTWDGYRLSLGGVGSAALISFLERHPQIDNVLLCMDNDKAGRETTERIIRQLLGDKRFSHLKITAAPPALGKDYNDCLRAVIQLNKQKSRSDRRKEAVCLF